MLVRLVVVVIMCVVWTSGELQCNGPGRFSTTPGMCTSEYYTCSRDANKEYVAYVLSCPGNTLFNERTRKCSNARTVFCVHPSTSTSSGQINVTTPRRERVTPGQTPWITQPMYGFELTTKRHSVEYRKPGRLPWVTPRPHFTTPNPLMTGAKPQINQWRIRVSTTERTTLATTSRPFVSPPKTLTQRRTYFHNRKKSTTIPKNVTRKVSTMGTTPSTKIMGVTATTSSTLTSIPQHPNIKVTTRSMLSANPTESLATPDVTSTNIYLNSLQTPTGILSSPTTSTPIMNSISGELLEISDNYTTKVTSNLLTRSIVTPKPISIQISKDENIFETTPAVIIKNVQSPIPLMDFLELGEQNVDIEIVDVVFNSNSNLTKPTEKESNKHNIPIKYISYFYDPDSYNKKIRHKKRRQPKKSKIRNETV